MNGVTVIRRLLSNSADVIALVPAQAIQAGPLPQGAGLPSISLMHVSGTDMNIPSPGANRFVTDRVQVTILASNYPQQKQVEAAVKKAAADKFPDAETISRVTVHTAGRGPDSMNEEASIYMGSLDFRVTYNEPT